MPLTLNEHQQTNLNAFREKAAEMDHYISQQSSLIEGLTPDEENKSNRIISAINAKPDDSEENSELKTDFQTVSQNFGNSINHKGINEYRYNDSFIRAQQEQNQEKKEMLNEFMQLLDLQAMLRGLSIGAGGSSTTLISEEITASIQYQLLFPKSMEKLGYNLLPTKGNVRDAIVSVVQHWFKMLTNNTEYDVDFLKNITTEKLLLGFQCILSLNKLSRLSQSDADRIKSILESSNQEQTLNNLIIQKAQAKLKEKNIQINELNNNVKLAKALLILFKDETIDDLNRTIEQVQSNLDLQDLLIDSNDKKEIKANIILILYSKFNIKSLTDENLQKLENTGLSDAVRALNKFNADIVLDKKEYDYLENEENKNFMLSLSVLKDMGEHMDKAKYDMLKSDPTLQKAIIACSKIKFLKEEWELLANSDNNNLKLAMSAFVENQGYYKPTREEFENLKNTLLLQNSIQIFIGGSFGLDRDRWGQIKDDETLQKALVCLKSANISLDDQLWRKLISQDESLKKAIAAFNGSDVTFSNDVFEELKKAVSVLKAGNIGLNTEIYNLLKENQDLRQAIAVFSQFDNNSNSKFKESCNDFKNILLKDLTSEITKSTFNIEQSKPYKQLKHLSQLVNDVTSNKDKKEKTKQIIAYENNAKGDLSAWERYGKHITAVVISSTCIATGLVAGAFIGSAITAPAGPGAIVGAVLGAGKGALIGASAGATVSASIVAGGSFLFFKYSKSEYQKGIDKITEVAKDR